MLRNKYPKEATVFRMKFSAEPFLRPDQSVDLFKARQALVQELRHALGEFRDYNGGMIAKQHEQFLALKGLFDHFDQKEEMLLENFFHSIFPIEMRSLFNPRPLKKMFQLLQEAMGKNKENGQKIIISTQMDEQHCFFLLSCDTQEIRDLARKNVIYFQIPHSKLLTIELQVLETFYLGYIYMEDEREQREIFLNNICRRLESLTFEAQTSYH
jgi:hypothetical protein